MTVAELKAIIKDLPDDMQVLVMDYEWGTHDMPSMVVETERRDQYKTETVTPFLEIS